MKPKTVTITSKLPFLLFSPYEKLPFNENAPIADEHTISRALRMNIMRNQKDVDRYNASQFTQLCATWYPVADAEALNIITDYFYFLWSFDDRIDEVAMESMGNVMETHKYLVGKICDITNHPERLVGQKNDRHVEYLKAMYDDLTESCLRRFGDGPSNNLSRRFQEVNMQYLVDGTLKNTERWLDHKSITLDEYIALRLFDSAIYPCIVLFEFGLNMCLSDEAFQDPDVLTAVLLHNRIIAIVNDIVSYEKEVITTSNPNNAIAVCMSSGQDFEQAVDTVAAYINNDWKTFEDMIARREGTWLNKDVEYFVKMLKDTAANVGVWHITSDRYCSTTSPFTELRKAE